MRLTATRNLTILGRRILGGDLVLPLTVQRAEGSCPKSQQGRAGAWSGSLQHSASLVLSSYLHGSKVNTGLTPGFTKAFLPFSSFLELSF